ncbi:MAG TPA: aldo/keto reductase [Pseudomonadota bacterium]|nr:aldo/keto reductase [Pseudomonadota bacterium]
MIPPAQPVPSLASYSLLGRSGLRVAPLALGTMTFGTEWGFGCGEAESRELFQRYRAAGGNFVDTADIYTGGTSERLLGKFIKELGCRDEVVLATKFTLGGRAGDPNSAGNGRKSILRAVEGSLGRLQTDYIDLYWMHSWDGLTPIEEVMDTLDSLVRAGKVRYLGLSNVPGFYLGRAQTLCELRGRERLCGLQLEYSLVSREIEREFIPAAHALGLGLCSWSPLGCGLLTGKYRRTAAGAEGAGRLQLMGSGSHPVFAKFTERNFQIAETLIQVAAELGRSPAQVAISWITRRPGVTSTILGATTSGQLYDTLQALELVIPAELSARLEAVSRPAPSYPYVLFGDSHAPQAPQPGDVNAHTLVRAEPPWFRA